MQCPGINGEEAIMSNLLAGVVISSFVFVSASALADGNDMTALTPAQTAQMRAERDAAKAKYAAMTPAEKDAVKQSMRGKQLKDLNAMERTSQNDDMGRYMGN